MEPAEIEAELDRLSIEILLALSELGTDATSAELRKRLGEDTTKSINYRRDEYLKPMGLIETHQPVDAGVVNQPKEWSLTEQGVEFVEYCDEVAESRPLFERVDSLDNQVASLRSSIQDLQRQFDDAVAEIEGTTESASANESTENTPSQDDAPDRKQLRQIRSQLDTLQDDIAGIHQRVQHIEQGGLYNETFRNQLNSAIAYAGVAREMLEKEYGEDVFEAALEEKAEEIVFLNTQARPESEPQ